MSKDEVKQSVTKNVLSRLKYLEFLLMFKGSFVRSDLMEKFGVAEAAASRDIKKYRELAPKNIKFDSSIRKYSLNVKEFEALFPLQPNDVVSQLINSSIDKVLDVEDYDGLMGVPRLAMPEVKVLSAITRAMSERAVIRCTYYSSKKGKINLLLAPHSIFDGGVYLYVRAYDLECQKYRSYKLSRFLDVSSDVIDSLPFDVILRDAEWHDRVCLELVVHPNRKNVKCSEAIEHDFRMVDGILRISLRAVVSGFWLKFWNVDCTHDHCLEGYEYQLWLQNNLILDTLETRSIAPGLSEISKSPSYIKI